MAAPKRKILILFAHPNQEASEVNVHLARAARGIEGVSVVDLYALYPALDIDIDLEQARLVEHDVIIFQHPMYWYSTPAILKEWQDLVLEYGFAYGKGGVKLRDKLFLNVVTAAGTQEAYGKRGQNQFTMRELLAPMAQTAELCGMVFLPPFVVFGARRARDKGLVAKHAADYVAILGALIEDALPLPRTTKLGTLNEDVDALLEGGARWRLF